MTDGLRFTTTNHPRLVQMFVDHEDGSSTLVGTAHGTATGWTVYGYAVGEPRLVAAEQGDRFADAIRRMTDLFEDGTLYLPKVAK
jgi:hypothetical protein